MSALGEAYDSAREAGMDAEGEARQVVERMSVEQLREEWVSLMAMLAYYSKLERSLYTNPRLYFDRAHELLDKLRDNEDDWESIESLISLTQRMTDYEPYPQPD